MTRSSSLTPALLVFCLLADACASDSNGEGGEGNDAGAGGAATGGRSSGGSGSGGSASGGANGGTGGSAGGGSGGSASGGSGGSPGSGGTSPDGGPGGPWTGCPTADDYLGSPGWPHALTVTENAVYCASFDETRTLKEELAAKALLRVAPGSFRLPGANQPTLGLPLCLQLSEGGTPIGVTAGEATYQESTFSGTSTHTYQLEQPLPPNPPGGRLSIRIDRTVPEGGVPAFRLDGTEVDLVAMESSHSFLWCPDGVDCYPNRQFDSCTHASSRLHTHVVTLAGSEGAVTFELRIGQSFASTEPGAFVRAHGSFRGEAFDQRSYWKLVYSPEHHHFTRHFAVLFDAPIAGACGLQITGLEPFTDDYEPDTAHTVTCALDTIDAITVAGHTHTATP